MNLKLEPRWQIPIDCSTLLLSQLRKLELSHCSSDNFDLLCHLPLDQLYLENVHGFTPIVVSESLRTLSLSQMQDVHLLPHAGLEHLFLQRCTFRVLDLQKMTKLKRLFMKHLDISILPRLPESIQVLEMDKLRYIRSLFPISGLLKLEYLQLYDLSITELPNLMRTRLETVVLDGLQTLKSIESLSQCQFLSQVSLSHLPALLNVPSLPKAKILNIGQTRQNDPRFILAFPTMRLDLSGQLSSLVLSRITLQRLPMDLPFLHHLSIESVRELSFLSLSGTPRLITLKLQFLDLDLPDLQSIQLQKLSLSYMDRIQSLDCLEAVQSLEHLDLDSLPIKSLQPLRHLPLKQLKLQRLDQLESLEGIQDIKTLENVHIRFMNLPIPETKARVQMMN
ncbi:hypothetical protein EDD86DRAFT_244360 [Gorgonomyces haynaldii]|nr:hypothetical protein EDD86DRAFT_244360 [Gorgonomyces haynaldii]